MKHLERDDQAPSKDIGGKKHAPPPVIVPRRGLPIPDMSRAEIRRIEEEEDAAKHA